MLLLHVDASIVAAKGYPRNMLLQGGNVPGERTELLLLFTNCIFLLVSPAVPLHSFQLLLASQTSQACVKCVQSAAALPCYDKAPMDV